MWAPRVLGILCVVLVGSFALDVFGQGAGPWKTLGALLVHLVPAFLVALAPAAVWRWPGAGAVLFLALAVLYVVWAWGRFSWTASVPISAPLALTGVLFLADWLYRNKLKKG